MPPPTMTPLHVPLMHSQTKLSLVNSLPSEMSKKNTGITNMPMPAPISMALRVEFLSDDFFLDKFFCR